MNSHSSLPEIDTLDQDGALRETAEKAGLLGHVTRRGALATGGAAAAALAFAGRAAAATPKASSTGDVAILNYALTLEYLEAAFYAQALTSAGLTGDTLKFATVTAKQEATHVATITKVITSLGGTPITEPIFAFGDTVGIQSMFQTTALTLETTGVSAYLGQAAAVKSDVILSAAAQILAVEARHTAWIADIIGKGSKPSPAPQAFATPLTMAQVLKAVNATGFITSPA